MPFILKCLPSQARAHALKSKYRGFSGPIGCIAGETVIDNPHGAGLSIAELHNRQLAPIVQTIYGSAQATVPIIKGIDDLYEVTLESGQSVRVTLNHLFYATSHRVPGPSSSSNEGWLPCTSLKPGDRLLVCADSHPRSTSERNLEASPLSALSSWQTVPSSLSRCSVYCRPCGEQPLRASDNAQGAFPSLADALGHNPHAFRVHALTDDPPATQEHSHPRQFCGRRAIADYSDPNRAVDDTEFHYAQCASERPTLLPRLASRSRQEIIPQRPFAEFRHRASDTLPTCRYTHSGDLYASLPSFQHRLGWSVIVNISYVRTDVFYDLHVPIAEHYFAHGIIHHNSGKSYWLCQHLFYLAERNAGRIGLLAAPTYRMLRDATEPTLFGVADELRIPLVHRKGDGYVELPKFGGSKILLRTLENPDRLRGPNLAFFGVDEASFSSEAAWLRLEGRLRDPRATERAAAAAWTPNGHNWIYRKFIKKERPNPDYEAVLAHPYENTHIDPGFYAGLLKSYSTSFARQEVLGEYLNVFSGRAYESFSSEAGGNIWHKAGGNHKDFLPCVYQPGRPILWSLDFNLAPATSVIAQTISHAPKPLVSNELYAPPVDSRVGGSDKQLNVIDEVFTLDINTEKHCELFYDKVRKQIQPGYKLHVIVYGDASGSRRQSSASESDYAIIRRFFSRHANEFQFEMRVASDNPAIKDRVNAVNGLCCNYNGVRRLAVHERAKHLIEDMEQHSWATDGAGNQQAVLNTKNPMIGHISDALGYLVYTEFSLRGTVGGKSGFIG